MSQKISLRFESEKYQYVYGDFIIDIPEEIPIGEPFDMAVQFIYKGTYNKGTIKNMTFSAICERNIENPYGMPSQISRRIVARDISLKFSQMFLITITEYNDFWSGFYSTIFPVDIGRLVPS